MVAWSEIEINRTWTEAGGSFDLGSYSMKLGSGPEIAGIQMYEIILSGDTAKSTPRWKWIGPDGRGSIYGSGTDQTPVLIYSVASDAWSGSGFYTDFDRNGTVTVNRNAEIIPSQYTKDLAFFDPPLTSVGYSISDQHIYEGSGCEYFPGYGTICGADTSSGPSAVEIFFEYWDADAGPVAMHYSYEYEDCLGTACNEKHLEQRVEVYFFGDTSSYDIGFENEPDTYANPSTIPVSESAFTIMGEINQYDVPSGYISGYEALVGMDVAARIHDWYAFEITAEDPAKKVEFYLQWDEPEVNLDFYLYSAPDNADYGFLYLDEGDVYDYNPDFEHTKYLSGSYLPGKYLLGVIRTTDSETATNYGIISISSVIP